MPDVEVDSLCRVPLEFPPGPVSVDLLHLAIDCTVVPMVAIPSGDGGTAQAPSYNWRVDDSTDPPSLEILGEYCAQVVRGKGRVDVLIGCTYHP